jgi:Rrf2 family protein
LLAITSKSPYAVRALTELARVGGAGPVPIGEIARRRDIPVQFLEGMFATLRRAGILQSQRGVKGGYSFRRLPSEVTILEVVETVDGRITPPSHSDDGADAVDGVWASARSTLAALLAGITIADIQEREARLRSAPMFHI